MSKQLAVNVQVDGVLYEAGSTPPKDIADQIDNPKAWATGDESVPEPEASPYDSMKPAELKAEVERRNAGRDADVQIEPDGKSAAALVAALKADDAAASGV